MITEKLDRIPFTSHFKWYLPLQTNDIFYFMINLRYSSVNVFILIEHQCLTEDEKGEIDLYCPVYDFFLLQHFNGNRFDQLPAQQDNVKSMKHLGDC